MVSLRDLIRCCFITSPDVPNRPHVHFLRRVMCVQRFYYKTARYKKNLCGHCVTRLVLWIHWVSPETHFSLIFLQFLKYTSPGNPKMYLSCFHSPTFLFHASYLESIHPILSSGWAVAKTVTSEVRKCSQVSGRGLNFHSQYMPRFFFNYKNSVIYNSKPAQVLWFLICILNMFGSNLGRDADHAD